jgi:hypothetical protein
MTEPSENILRKSLDSVDRRQRWIKTISVAFVVLGSANTALAMIYLQDMRLLYIATFVGLVLWTGGLALAVMAVSYRNARLILRAVALLSDASVKLEPGRSSGVEQELGARPNSASR